MPGAVRLRLCAALLPSLAIACIRSGFVDVPCPAPVTLDVAPRDPNNEPVQVFGFARACPTALFACRLDQGAAFICTSPQSFTELGEGSHWFEVRGRGRDLKWSAPATHSWTIDRTMPEVTALRIREDGATTPFPVVAVTLSAQDSRTPIERFCLRSNQSTRPSGDDPCWTGVASPALGLTPGLDLQLADYSYLLGFLPGSYLIYAFVADAAGNISSLSGNGTGTTGRDCDDIVYAPKPPPLVTQVEAANTAAPDTPPSQTQLVATRASDVFVWWQASDSQGLPAAPIHIFFTADDRTFVPVVSGLPNAAGAGCSLRGTATGCFAWTGGAPTEGYFRLRVVAEDTLGQRSGESSVPLNTPRVRYLAGSTDPGTGLCARSARFTSDVAAISYADSQSFVVTRVGRILFRDQDRGLLSVDPADGNQRVLIPVTGQALGDGGPIDAATLGDPIKLALDFDEQLLILDHDRIRRVDLEAQPPTIETLIGGGASADDGVAATDVRITPPTGLHRKWALLAAVPSGDIYFQSEGYTATIAEGYRLRVLDRQLGLVRSIVPSGRGGAIYGNEIVPDLDLQNCWLERPALTFDPASGEVSDLFVSLRGTGDAGVCAGNKFATARLDPRTGVATGPHLFLYPMYHTFTAPTGQLFAVNHAINVVTRLDVTQRGWVVEVGNGGYGLGADGTPALECAIVADDAAVDPLGRIYFAGLGRVRYLDTGGAVWTISGGALSQGSTLPATARLSSVSDVVPWHDGVNDRIVVLDYAERRIRELTPGVSLVTLAGNGCDGVPDVTRSALEQGLSMYMGNNTAYPTLAVHPSDGRVFFNRGGANVAFLDRARGVWTDLVGGGDIAYHAAGADGQPGSALDISSGYRPSVLGQGGDQIAVGLHWYLGGFFQDYMVKLFDMASGTQEHLVGQNGPVAESYQGAFCPDGTALDDCFMPRPVAMDTGKAHDDAAHATWYFTERGTGIVRAMPWGGVIGTAAQLPRSVTAVAYRFGATGLHRAYYCSEGGLFAFDVSTQVEWPLPLPTSSMACAGFGLWYRTATGSLVFGFEQQGLAGVAEYLTPDNP